MVVGGVTEVQVGEEIVYNITVTNNGLSEATGVNVTEHLSNLVVVTGAVGDGVWNNATKVWHIDSIANGTSATLVLTVKVIHVGSVSNAMGVNSLKMVQK